MPEIEIVTDQHDACGEGPLWDPSLNSLYWVDIIGERLHTCSWSSRRVITSKPGVPISAVALTASHDLVIAGTDGIWFWNPEQVPRPLVREINGDLLSINDCIVDERGRLLAGSTFYDGTDSYPLGALYSIGLDRAISTLDNGFGLSNGMGFSPDSTTLYFTDSAARRIYAYDYDLETGAVANRRTFVQVSSDHGLPDGLTVDAEGFVWSAQWFGSCIVRYDAEGVLERQIRIPADQISSVAFGGPDMTDMFVTSAGTPDALALAPSGYQATKNVGGQLFHLNIEIQGKPEFCCRISP